MATEIIPDQYGQWTLIWSVAGSPRECAITCGYLNIEETNTNEIIVRLQSALGQSSFGLLDPIALSEDYTISRLYVLQKRGGILESDTQILNIAGTSTELPPPVTTSLVVAKNTQRAGRQFRGRFAIPAGYVDEADVDSVNVITSGQVTAYNATFAAIHTSMVNQFIPPVLLHSEPIAGPAFTPPPTPVTSFTVRSQMGSDRRRLKRITA